MLKIVILRFIENFKEGIKAILYRNSLIMWTTNDFRQWLLLQNVLYKTKPKKLIEFGSGRSTNYIAEYAYKSRSKLVSIEENFMFAFRLKRFLAFSNLPKSYVRWVPIKGDWYDTEKLKDLKSIKFDFIFIDGPSAANVGRRDSKKGIEFMKNIVVNATVILVDDVHRKNVQDATKEILETWDKSGSAYIYKDSRKKKSWSVYFVDSGYQEAMDRINKFLSLSPKVKKVNKNRLGDFDF